jgi:branched-subunit amino acid aminotransferase/4-amino-4-deoxychorismate lyase
MMVAEDRNGVVTVFTSEESVKSYLQKRRGAYTALRTVNGDSLVDWAAHMTRLLSSIQKTEGATFAGNQQTLECICLGLIKAAIPADCKSDYKLIILATSEGRPVTVVLCEPLVESPPKPCWLCVYGNPRTIPNAKDTAWISERQYIEAVKPSHVTDMILCKGTKLYETTVSNFFVIVEDDDGQLAVITAPLEYVLCGTVLQAVQLVCQQKGIRFRYEFPDLANRSSWVCAFITSILF